MRELSDRSIGRGAIGGGRGAREDRQPRFNGHSPRCASARRRDPSVKRAIVLGLGKLADAEALDLLTAALA